MPSYYWHKKPEDSTLDPRKSGLVEEIVNKQQESMSTQSHRQVNSSTLDSRRSELVEERVDPRPTTARQGRENVHPTQDITD